MEARVLRLMLVLISLVCSTGAGFQSRNFTVTAPDQATAERVAKAAENYRRDLAIYWLGQPLPDWSRPCRVRVKVGAMGAGGETRFQFIGREVVNWDMVVQGSLERILDSVLPHEVNHTIFACHFRRPLPRWADEGAATLFEHRSEQAKQLFLLNQVIESGRGFIELERLMQMKEYPREYRAMLILYAEGYALVDFLVQQGGRDRYLKFLQDGDRMGWTRAIKLNYAHKGIDALQDSWKSWIVAGMPKLTDPKEELLAARATITRNALQPGARPTALSNLRRDSTIRLQSPTSSPTARREAQTASATPERAVADRSRGPGHAGASPVRTAAVTSPPAAHQSLANTGRTTSPPTAARAATAGGSRDSRSRRDDFRAASFEAPRPASGTLVVGRTASGNAASQARTRTDASAPTRRPMRRQERPGELPSTRPATGSGGDGTLDQNFLPKRPPAASTSSATATPATAPTTSGNRGLSETSGGSPQQKLLPQERSGKSGSLPQWAGFPGRVEAF